jgi:anti-anti-sigma regulatory factor
MRLEQAVTAESAIRLDGIFDGLAARRLEALLVAADAGVRLRIDLTQVREFHDFGIAVLGLALTRSRAHVTIRGLRQHQVRVLRYFGVDTGPLESAVLSDAA